MSRRIRVEDIGKKSEQLTHVDLADLMPLPAPFDRPDDTPAWPPLTDQQKAAVESSLDDTVAIGIPRPQTRAEEDALVIKFLSGLEKLFSAQNNWTFLHPLLLSMDHCAQCHTCSDACHIYEASGRNPVYRPAYRSEVLRRLYHKHVKFGGRLLARWRTGEIDLNWTTVARLAELAYRCNLCRRCAQACPVGVDNGLIAHEIRKIFHQEMGIAPKEIDQRGAELQLKVGSSTGMRPEVVRDNMDFIDDDMSEKTGLKIKTPWDVKGAEILLIHNAGEILAWPENPGAFNVILQQAGVNYTLSSEALGYDAINYGLWYDDFMLAKVVLRHVQAAKKLGVKKIVIGECGHSHKALTVIADRILTGDLAIPRESSLTLLRDIVMSGKLKLDPARNDFPVTLHDPCNMVRLMGIVEPQREILRRIAPRFREMTPHGVDNYCCGGGSGFAVMSPYNFEHWRFNVAGRKKLAQVLGAFAGECRPGGRNYLCAPCSNCKGQLRDLLRHYGAFEKCGILYGGLVELIVNAMTDVKPGFIEWEWH